ncbi:MAG: Eco57I restriction-modification methylase domain-containing protein [Phycisphaerae bacterium]|nr:Eco57I restriction-modification methylase domain-containing protein [Phycisphaerae bacterium]
MSRPGSHGPRLFAAVPGMARWRVEDNAVRDALAALDGLPSAHDADASARASMIDNLGLAHERLLASRLAIRWRADGSAEVSLTTDPARKATGAYYTPPEVVAELIRTSLEPTMAERLAGASPAARARALLAIRICDPACGGGCFLIAAARRLALEVACARTGESEPRVAALRRAMRDVLARCVYGVDLDPLAVDVCRLSLALEVHEPGRPMLDLESTIRCGDALAGVHDLSAVANGVPEVAFAARAGDDRAHARELARSNRRALSSAKWGSESARIAEVLGAGVGRGHEGRVGPRSGVGRVRALCDVWTAAFFQPMSPTQPGITSETLALGAGSRRRWPAGVLSAIEWARACARQRRFFHWPLEFPEVLGTAGRPRGFDVVLGNPPFLSQLSRATTAERGLANLIAARHGRGGYADLSAVFLLDAERLARPGGRVAMVLPRSFLAARDAGWVRERLLKAARLETLWIADGHAFTAASVYACAPTLRRLATDPAHTATPDARRIAVEVTRAAKGERRRSVVEVETRVLAESWAALAAGDVPIVEVKPLATIEAHATAAADFRDEYYGLVGFVVDGDHQRGEDPAMEREFPRLITAGLIEPAACLWGQDSTRLHKSAWRAPRLDRRRMEAEGTLGCWLGARLVPKVLVATQTRVIEAVVDERGEWAPTTPVVSVMPREPARLWHVAAAVSSPVACAVAARLYGGTGLTPGVIKVSARQLLSLPTPCVGRAWDEGAIAFRAASSARSEAARLAALRRMGEAMVEASGVANSGGMLEWWWGRLTAARSGSARKPVRASR